MNQRRFEILAAYEIRREKKNQPDLSKTAQEYF